MLSQNLKTQTENYIHYTNLGGQQRSKRMGYEFNDKELNHIIEYVSTKNVQYVTKVSRSPYFIYYEE
jgi:hypothetical protein